MEFNYFKTCVMSALAIGAFAFSASAAAPVSVLPEQNTVDKLDVITLEFNQGDQVAWSVTSTETAPYLTMNGVRVSTAGGAYSLLDSRDTRHEYQKNNPDVVVPVVADNVLKYDLREDWVTAGEYELVVPAGAYTVNGVPGDEVKKAWTVTGLDVEYKGQVGDLDKVIYSVQPASEIVTQLSTVVVAFRGHHVVSLPENTDAENTPKLYRLNDAAIGEETNGLKVPVSELVEELNVFVAGDDLVLTTSAPITEPGSYKIEIPKTSYFIDNAIGYPLSLNYTIYEDAYPSYTYVADPASGSEIEMIETINVTFDFLNLPEDVKEGVKWSDDIDTTTAPYITDMTGARYGTFYNISSKDNTLTMTINGGFEVKGNYRVVIPAGAYTLDGYLVMPGKEIVLDYTVQPKPYLESVTPAVDWIETLETIELTFGNVDIVDWTVTGTENAPYLADLEGNRWATFTNLSGNGNVLTMSFNEEFVLKGEYVVVIPEGAYEFKDCGSFSGPGPEITLSYEILGLTGITVEPAAQFVTEIQNVKITFNEARVVSLSEELGTTNTPYLYLVDAEGNREPRGAMYPSVYGNSMLLTMNTPITDEGDYVIVVPGTCYFMDGNEGSDVEISYTIIPDGKLKYTVDPEEGTVSELHTFAITFTGVEQAMWNVNDMKVDDSLMPTMTCDGGYPEVLTNLYSDGNVLSLTINSVDPIRANGHYVVTIPAGSYYVDGDVFYQEIILAYNLDSTTAVEAIFGAGVKANVYDIDGRVVVRNADAETIKSLRGIYVINGKKVILH